MRPLEVRQLQFGVKKAPDTAYKLVLVSVCSYFILNSWELQS